MKKANIVKENALFNDIISTGKCVKNKNLVIYYNINKEKRYRFGISVGKKIGNAVTRNYQKRRIRNIVDNHKNLYSNDLDYIIIIRRNVLNEDFIHLDESFVQLMNNINKMRERSTK